MEFLKLIEERYSVRSFKPCHIEQEKIDKILRCAHLAPTGCNNQPQRILVLNSDESTEKLKLCTRSHFNAPTAMLVCYNKDEVWRRRYDGKSCGVSDACIVATHIMLGAWDLGIGSTWVMSFDPFAMREQFDIPENIEPVALLVMGYASDDSVPNPLHSKYRDLDEVVVNEKFK